jgi:voltage-gated potassium channel
MSKSPFSARLEKFVTATTGRNMTKPAYVAVTCGVAMMVLLTVEPAYSSLHAGIDTLLWACLAFFVFEWVIRLRHAARTGHRSAYLFSFRGIVDAASALAVPIALAVEMNPKSAWLLGMFWVLKVVPGIRGLRQLRRVLVQESGPLLSVLVIFLVVLFMASIAEFYRDPHHDRIWRRGADHPARPHHRRWRHDLRPWRVRPVDRHPRHRLCRRNPPR